MEALPALAGFYIAVQIYFNFRVIAYWDDAKQYRKSVWQIEKDFATEVKFLKDELEKADDRYRDLKSLVGSKLQDLG